MPKQPRYEGDQEGLATIIALVFSKPRAWGVGKEDFVRVAAAYFGLARDSTQWEEHEERLSQHFENLRRRFARAGLLHRVGSEWQWIPVRSAKGEAAHGQSGGQRSEGREPVFVDVDTLITQAEEMIDAHDQLEALEAQLEERGLKPFWRVKSSDGPRQAPEKGGGP